MKFASTPPDASTIIGPSHLGRLFNRSRYWGKDMLLEWAAKEARDGVRRVFQKRGCLFTTMAVVYREMPPGSDRALLRRIEGLEKDVAFLHRKLDGVLRQAPATAQARR